MRLSYDLGHHSLNMNTLFEMENIIIYCKYEYIIIIIFFLSDKCEKSNHEHLFLIYSYKCDKFKVTILVIDLRVVDDKEVDVV